MQNLVKLSIVFFFSVFSIKAQEKVANEIVVTVSNFNSNQGKAYVSLYKTEDSFLKEGYISQMVLIKNKTCKVVFKDIPNGIYAVSMYHDENDNKKLDTGTFGIPKEDYGCSNNAKGFMGPPKWEDAKFSINNETINQYIKL